MSCCEQRVSISFRRYESVFATDGMQSHLDWRSRVDLRFGFNDCWFFVFEPFGGTLLIFRVTHVDAPVVRPDCVDGPTRLDPQIDCIRKFIFAAAGGLDKVARVEDLGRKRIQASQD